MKRVLIRNGRVLDPEQKLDAQADVLIVGDRVEAIGPGLGAGAAADEVVDAEGLWVLPGLIDIHVHLRTPGETHKETLASGGAAAAAGGFTQVVCMPNTNPPLDDPIRVEWLRWKAERESPVRVQVAAAVTKGLSGEMLTAIASLTDAGAVAITDDGRPITDANLAWRAFTTAAALDLPVLLHEEEPALSDGGAMHAGPVAESSGMPGIPSAAEAVMVARDLLLAEQTGARIHIMHVSCRETVDLIRWARSRGVNVTAEVSPHHLLLTEDDVAASGFDPSWKMNPPLRSDGDRQALIEAVIDGTIDAIATDHAPHHVDDKQLPFPEAAFGIVGLETAVGLILDAFVPAVISPLRFAELLSSAPARCLSLTGGTLRPGTRADVTIIDPLAPWTIDRNLFRSSSRNTPFHGRNVTGRVVRTMVAGRTVYEFERSPQQAESGEVDDRT